MQIENIEIVCATYEQWHESLCHPAPGTIDSRLYQDQVFSMKSKNFHCTACALGKSIKTTPEGSTNKAKEPLNRIYLDLFRKFPIQSAEGALYYVFLIDEKN